MRTPSRRPDGSGVRDTRTTCRAHWTNGTPSSNGHGRRSLTSLQIRKNVLHGCGSRRHLRACSPPTSGNGCMRRSDLEHLIRAAGRIADEHELVIIGSQAILGQFPHASRTRIPTATWDYAWKCTTLRFQSTSRAAVSKIAKGRIERDSPQPTRKR